VVKITFCWHTSSTNIDDCSGAQSQQPPGGEKCSNWQSFGKTPACPRPGLYISVSAYFKSPVVAHTSPERLFHILNTQHDNSAQNALRIEAAHIIASLSYGQ
jgi:hypothetical protein